MDNKAMTTTERAMIADELAKALELYVDDCYVGNSYGVHGSDFDECKVCGASNEPGRRNKIEHFEDCLVAKHEYLLARYEASKQSEKPDTAQDVVTAPREPTYTPADMANTFRAGMNTARMEVIATEPVAYALMYGNDTHLVVLQLREAEERASAARQSYGDFKLRIVPLYAVAPVVQESQQCDGKGTTPLSRHLSGSETVAADEAVKEVPLAPAAQPQAEVPGWAWKQAIRNSDRDSESGDLLNDADSIEARAREIAAGGKGEA